MEEPIRIKPTQVVELVYAAQDLPNLYEALEKAKNWFNKAGQDPPVELMDVRDHPVQGKVTVVLLYDRPGDLFNLGSVQASIKEKRILDKVINWVNYEIEHLLTPQSN